MTSAMIEDIKGLVFYFIGALSIAFAAEAARALLWAVIIRLIVVRPLMKGRNLYD